MWETTVIEKLCVSPENSVKSEDEEEEEAVGKFHKLSVKNLQ